MTYDFDEIIDRRHTNALNTDGFRGYIFHAGPEKKFPFADDEFVRMWVADMEFATPPEICPFSYLETVALLLQIASPSSCTVQPFFFLKILIFLPISSLIRMMFTCFL